ncbi:hypothetical protein KO361_01925 [Candidatus Woesearchaeota archaeon]|nr:hypothetical protein [Candidatus Woesearchaeota archaeon]
MLDLLKKKTKVILDTNFLFIPGELGIDVFTEIDKIIQEPYELCVMESTIHELENILKETAKQKQGLNAKLALILIKQKNLKTIRSSFTEYADDSIIEYTAQNPKTIIATQDKDLRNRIKKIPARIIKLRQKKYLEMG